MPATETEIDGADLGDEQRRHRARRTLDQLRTELLDQRGEQGNWTGFLSPSALSTATAISALSAVLIHDPSRQDAAQLREMIGCGIEYLQRQQNDDGGFGDTDLSHSNIATSYLVLSASCLAERVGITPLDAKTIDAVGQYIRDQDGLDGLRRRYGKDKTFVVPIMNNMAIAGLISWDEVAALPFEAAVFPQSMYRFLRMPVVSYAIPALVAIGQARHFLGKPAVWPIRQIRSLSVQRTLRVLKNMQPESGGYLEATPLTAFVVMSLAATGRCDLSVVKAGLQFLKDSMLEEGSWPIDTNLATWVTSLSVHALACDPDDDGHWYSDALALWHLSCQHKQRHPFTGAEPGGWGWTDLSGAVPDSDDTPAAILATERMRRYASAEITKKIDAAQTAGLSWLMRLQNRNGGWPTFCRGWGKLPFDRSSTDLTAHAIRAFKSAAVSSHLGSQAEGAIASGFRFLRKQQSSAGQWEPLWFGNQDDVDEANPIYGTSKVLLTPDLPADLRHSAVSYLVEHQNDDGGWGGGVSVSEKLSRIAAHSSFGTENQIETVKNSPKPIGARALGVPSGLVSTVEETALATEALATVLLAERKFAGDQRETPSPLHRSGGALSETVGRSNPTVAGKEQVRAAILRGVDFLLQSVDDQRHTVAWPIGFYFAKLWYHERLYPLIFTIAALGKFLRVCDDTPDDDWPG